MCCVLSVCRRHFPTNVYRIIRSCWLWVLFFFSRERTFEIGKHAIFHWTLYQSIYMQNEALQLEWNDRGHLNRTRLPFQSFRIPFFLCGLALPFPLLYSSQCRISSHFHFKIVILVSFVSPRSKQIQSIITISIIAIFGRFRVLFSARNLLMKHSLRSILLLTDTHIFFRKLVCIDFWSGGVYMCVCILCCCYVVVSF